MTFLIHTGSIIQEYIEEAGLNQKQLAQIMGVSTKHLSNVLNGNARVTPEFALKLEEALPAVPASYWINYDGRYQEQLLRDPRYEKLKRQDLFDLEKRFHFKSVFGKTPLNRTEQALHMLSILGIQDYECFSPSTAGIKFMKGDSEAEALEIWLKLAQNEFDIQNNISEMPEFNIEKLQSCDFGILRDISLNTDLQESIDDCRTILRQWGIGLITKEAIENSKVRGALIKSQNHPIIMVSGLYKTHDHVWFAIMHEFGHLIHGDLQKNRAAIVELEDSTGNASLKEEKLANKFAQDFFIPKDQYESFLNKNLESLSTNVQSRDHIIKAFSAELGIDPGILAGRLEHEGILSHSEARYFKTGFEVLP